MTDRITYRVTAEYDGKWWIVDIPEISGAFTQARKLADVKAMAREVVALLLDVSEDSFDLDVQPQLPEGVADEVRRVHETERRARALEARAAANRRDVANRLRRSDLSLADVGAVLGVSTQRASQLVDPSTAGAKKHTGRRKTHTHA